MVLPGAIVRRRRRSVHRANGVCRVAEGATPGGLTRGRGCWRLLALLHLGMAACAPGTSLRLGEPSGHHAQWARELRVCVVGLGPDQDSADQKLIRIGEPLALAARQYTLVVSECWDRTDAVPRFTFKLRAQPHHEYELAVTAYTPSMGGPEGPSKIQEMVLRDVTDGTELARQWAPRSTPGFGSEMPVVSGGSGAAAPKCVKMRLSPTATCNRLHRARREIRGGRSVHGCRCEV